MNVLSVLAEQRLHEAGVESHWTSKTDDVNCRRTSATVDVNSHRTSTTCDLNSRRTSPTGEMSQLARHERPLASASFQDVNKDC